jgi:antibiotic biosynthesis monooxygenase (ABM) superfamily enzyme
VSQALSGSTVTRRVKPGHERAREEFLEGIITAARRFPDYLGVDLMRPSGGRGEPCCSS